LLKETPANQISETISDNSLLNIQTKEEKQENDDKQSLPHPSKIFSIAA
jgi:hypothetical protein